MSDYNYSDIAQLKQIGDRVIWDGDLISKTSRDRLYKDGFVNKECGYNFITANGIKELIRLTLLDHNKKPFPCPFCGSKQIELRGATGEFFYQCKVCDGAINCGADDQDMALREWNKRTPEYYT